MARRLDNKVAVVTGASRGIGKAVALAYAREGAALVLCSRARDVEETGAQVRELGGRALAGVCDVADPEQVREFLEEAVRRFKRLDVLVNNAGLLGPRAALDECPADAWRRTLEANLSGVFHMSRAAVRLSMRSNRSGSIINVTSGAGRRGKALYGAYCASKFGVEGLTQVAAEEWKAHGIRVNAVNPGPTRTRLREEFDPAEDPLSVKPCEAVTPAFVFLASDESARHTGRSFDVDPKTGELT